MHGKTCIPYTLFAFVPGDVLEHACKHGRRLRLNLHDVLLSSLRDVMQFASRTYSRDTSPSGRHFDLLDVPTLTPTHDEHTVAKMVANSVALQLRIRWMHNLRHLENSPL